MGFPPVPKPATPDALQRWLGDVEKWGKANDRRVDQLEAPEVQLVTGAVTILPSWDVVVYAGAGGDVVLLPSAGRIAGRRSRPLVFMNVGAGTVTLAAQGGQTVAGAATVSVGSGVKLGLASDGESRWLS